MSSTPETPSPAAPAAAPALWNPNAAGLWSVLFTPTFGAWLHMKNWQALGDEQKAAQSRTWAWGNVAMIVLFAVLGILLPDLKALDGASRGAGIGVLVAWWMTLGRVQKELVMERYGKTYPRRGWAKPLGYALLVILGLIVVAALGISLIALAGAGDSSSGSGSPHL